MPAELVQKQLQVADYDYLSEGVCADVPEICKNRRVVSQKHHHMHLLALLRAYDAKIGTHLDQYHAATPTATSGV
jgi:hypothetical protein